MTASAIKLATTAEDHHIARMAALALGLSVLEAAIPSLLPGVKPGLANIVILIVLARYGWRTAVWVSLLRVLAGSLLFGNFLAPGFFLSFGGALCSLAVLAASQHLPTRWFGPVTHSILAAFAHIAGQLLVVYWWLIPHVGIVYLIPVFAVAALVFGTVNGLVAAHYCSTPSLEGRGASARNSLSAEADARLSGAGGEGEARESHPLPIPLPSRERENCAICVPEQSP